MRVPEIGGGALNVQSLPQVAQGRVSYFKIISVLVHERVPVRPISSFPLVISDNQCSLRSGSTNVTGGVVCS